MSSDSEDDDCYGNIAQKLQSMKNKYSDDKIQTTNLLIADLKENSTNSWRKNDSHTPDVDYNVSHNSEPAEELSLDAIIANNSQKRLTRSRKRLSEACVGEILLETVSKSSKRKKNNSSTSRNKETTTSENVSKTDVIHSALSIDDGAAHNNNVHDNVSNRNRGRGRGRSSGSARQTTKSRDQNQPTSSVSSTVEEGCADSSRARGRNKRKRGRGRKSWVSELCDPAIYDLARAIAESAAMAGGDSGGPVYSIGNTHEYPDQCHNQPLFNNAISKPKINAKGIEENELEYEDNEELSVKVYWQSSEHVKFNICRFQKLALIYNHFAKRENVNQDKLFFTYNDKILKNVDTPDSIGYNIAKFIEGGIVNERFSNLIKKHSKESGLKLKFQCQNIKKPFVVNIQVDEKMSEAMIKCAEHLERPLEQLKFHFDGDLISGNDTPHDLELEGDECIDVKIIK